jgi:hypothetical protein
MKKYNNRLSYINKDNPFIIPEGFFDSFPSRLSEKIHNPESAGIYEKYILTLKPYLAIAALFIGVVIIGIISYNVLHRGNNIQKLKADEMANLINEDVYYLSDESIMEVINLNNAGTGNDKFLASEDNITNEVIDYLINEGIDITDIIDAF